MSLPEVLLWQVLRARPNGLKFRRQFPVGQITTDFACLDCRLAIEVDGDSHSFGDQPRRDAARDILLQRNGFTVMRIPARDVLRDLNAVVTGIVSICSDVGPLHQPAAGPPPRPGEDLP
jgi:very-short-patch-repair endonuclease